MTGIVDQALEINGEDSLSISNYTLSLLNFIENTATPMTIGIQEEWGSGKKNLKDLEKAQQDLKAALKSESDKESNK